MSAWRQCEWCVQELKLGDYFTVNTRPLRRLCFDCRIFDIDRDLIFRVIEMAGQYSTEWQFRPTKELDEFIQERQQVRQEEIDKSLDQLIIRPLIKIVLSY